MQTGVRFSRIRAAAFTRTELLVIIGVVGLLAAVLLVTFGSSSEQKRRIQCRSHLQQLGRSLQLYATDYRNLLPDCTQNNPRFYGSHWPWDLHTNLVAELQRRGASRKVFYCPSNREMDDEQRWNFHRYTGVPIRVTGYVFLLKGCTQVPPTLWRTSLAGDGTTPPAQTELVVDATVSRLGDYAHIQGKWVDRTSHLGKGGRPLGGNIVFADGHTEWRDFGQMRHRIFGDAVWDF